MKVASPQPLQPLPPPSPAAPSASPAPAAPRREPHGHEQPPHSDPSPALPPYLTESDVPLTPGATLTDLAAQPIAHKPAVHRSASPIATVAGPAPGPVSGLIFNHKAPVQVPLDLEPIAYKPSPPIIGGEQLAPVSPVGAPGAVSSPAPTASREEIAALELLLRSPESQAIVRDFGSASASASGVPGGNAVADSIIQRYGPDLAARLNQLHQAQNAVRQQYLDAMNAMRQARQQLGEAIVNRINYDLREFNHAYNTGDWRRAGQQFGLMVNALTQAAGGAQGLARGAQAAARGGARLAGRGLEALADAVANAKPATARLRQTGGAGYLLRRKLMKLLPDMVILEHDSHIFLRILNIY